MCECENLNSYNLKMSEFEDLKMKETKTRILLFSNSTFPNFQIFFIFKLNKQLHPAFISISQVTPYANIMQIWVIDHFLPFKTH